MSYGSTAQILDRFCRPMPWEAEAKPIPEESTKPNPIFRAFIDDLEKLEEKHDMRLKPDGCNIIIHHQETEEEEWL